MDIIPSQNSETRVRIRALDTGARVETMVRTPGGKVEYKGDARVAGIPGAAAPATRGSTQTRRRAGK
jgi:2-methylaconitate cis-trans-isomerase PrpF